MVTYSRSFYIAWFGLFTIVSMVLNGLHAALTAPRAWSKLPAAELAPVAPTWFAVAAVGVSLVPPVGLAAATHALVKPDPTTSSGRGTGARTTAWSIAAAALAFSTVMVTDLTRMLLDVPVGLAVLIPLIVDVSIVGAVLRLEIRRAGHAAEAHLDEHGELTEDVQESAPETSGELIEDSPENVPESVRESPKVRPEVRSRRAGFATEIEVLAQRVSDETTITIPSRTIEAVLRRTAQGDTRGKISSQLKGVSPTTVGRIVAAARGFDGEKEGELVAA